MPKGSVDHHHGSEFVKELERQELIDKLSEHYPPEVMEVLLDHSTYKKKANINWCKLSRTLNKPIIDLKKMVLEDMRAIIDENYVRTHEV